MKINNHWLEGAARELFPAMGDLKNPTVIVLHYTAGGTASGAVNAFKSSGVNAHLVVERDGSVIQCIPFDEEAWHAGRSRWEGKSGVNRFSFGIEIVNAGLLKKVESKTENFYMTWFNRRISEEDVHADKNGAYWHKYTEEQYKIVAEICQALMKRYPSIREVTGHENVAPGRKIDPGKAWNWKAFGELLKYC